jgi:hypothetical protein
MQLIDRLFIERFPKLVQQAILTEFQERPPTVHEIAQILDAHWLMLPGMGPTRLARLRVLAESMRQHDQTSALTGMTVAELLSRYDRLTVLQDRLQARLNRILNDIWTTRVELWTRGIIPHAK